MMRFTSRPAIRPASFVACRCVSSKYAGTVMTASVIFSPRNASASAFSFCKIIADTSCGEYDSPESSFTRTPSLFPSFSTVYGTRPFVFETSESSNRRPMKRLMLKTVFFGFVTAWRLASCPTTRSPPFTKPTTDGTVRPPSAELMTVGSPPTIAATTLFVVPRSIPIIFPIWFLLSLFGF